MSLNQSDLGSTAAPEIDADGERTPFSLLVVLVYLCAHLGLAAALATPRAATAHAVLTVVGVGLVCVLAREPLTLVLAAAYVMGCDVLWRMTQAAVPWEVAKYLLMGLGVVGLIRFVARPRGLGWPFVFLAVLVPGALVTVDALGLEGARDALSFNLAGVVALVLWWALARNLRTSRGALVDVLWVALGPILAVNAFAWAVANGLTPDDFQSGASNSLASGGFGPNQVVGVLSLGIVIGGFLLAFDRRMLARVVAVGLVAWFAVEAGLTFSRGGLLAVAVAAVLAVPHFFGDRKRAMRILGVALIGYLIAVLVVVPTVQQISGNKFGERFTDLDTTLRTEIAGSDLELFAEQPFLGVGVGQADERRDLYLKAASHTEFTRLLAEHGLFGVVALVALIAMAVGAYRLQGSPSARAWAIALLGWSVITMANTATRFAAVSFAFGLAALAVDVSRESVALGPYAESADEPDST